MATMCELIAEYERAPHESDERNTLGRELARALNETGAVVDGFTIWRGTFRRDDDWTLDVQTPDPRRKWIERFGRIPRASDVPAPRLTVPHAGA